MQPNPKAESAEKNPTVNGRPERRKRNIPAATDRRKHDHSESEGSGAVASPVEDEATAFKKAMDRYKRENRRPFPTWSEVLEVLRSLGYRKVADETDLPGTKKEIAGPPPAKG
jgi:hypothetical protein